MRSVPFVMAVKLFGLAMSKVFVSAGILPHLAFPLRLAVVLPKQVTNGHVTFSRNPSSAP
jgi:hypothetical protein